MVSGRGSRRFRKLALDKLRKSSHILFMRSSKRASENTKRKVLEMSSQEMLEETEEQIPEMYREDFENDLEEDEEIYFRTSRKESKSTPKKLRNLFA